MSNTATLPIIRSPRRTGATESNWFARTLESLRGTKASAAGNRRAHYIQRVDDLRSRNSASLFVNRGTWPDFG